MKKTISNALLCGLVASTFILVNCQNDPAKRGVKADVGTPASTEVSAKSAADNFPVCTPEFLSAYDVFLKASNSSDASLNTKKEDVNATVKESLLRIRKEVTDSGQAAYIQLRSIKVEPDSTADANADSSKAKTTLVAGCFKSDDKKNPITREKIIDEINRVDLRVLILTGVRSKLNMANEAEKKAAQGNSMYSVSTELREILGLPTSATNNYLVDGKITDSATLIHDQSDKAKAVCRVTLGGNKLSDVSAGLVLMSNAKTKLNAEKDIYEMNLSSGENFYQITCFLPAGVKFEDGLAQAVGQNLTLIKVAKKDAAPVPAEVKPAVTPAATSAVTPTEAPAAASAAQDVEDVLPDTDSLTS